MNCKGTYRFFDWTWVLAKRGDLREELESICIKAEKELLMIK